MRGDWGSGTGGRGVASVPTSRPRWSRPSERGAAPPLLTHPPAHVSGAPPVVVCRQRKTGAGPARGWPSHHAPPPPHPTHPPRPPLPRPPHTRPEGGNCTRAPPPPRPRGASSTDWRGVVGVQPGAGRPAGRVPARHGREGKKGGPTLPVVHRRAARDRYVCTYVCSGGRLPPPQALPPHPPPSRGRPPAWTGQRTRAGADRTVGWPLRARVRGGGGGSKSGLGLF